MYVACTDGEVEGGEGGGKLQDRIFFDSLSSRALAGATLGNVSFVTLLVLKVAPCR